MRTLNFALLAALVACGTLAAQTAVAVPLTGEVGPGGVGRTDGTSPLVLWLNADTIGQTNGTAVSFWVDSSGKANHATQGTGGAEPLFQTAGLNGHASVGFSQGSGHHLDTTNSINNAGAESFFFASQLVAGTDRAFLGNTGSGNYTLRDRTSAIEWNINNFNTPPTFASGIRLQPALGTTPLIFSGVRDVPGTGNIALYKNGALNGVVGTGHTAVVTGNYIIGSRGGTSEFFNGQMGEVIAFADNVTTTERTLVENYLSAKFTMPISNDVYSGDTLHGFTSNVFGVGQDSTDTVGVTNAGAAGFGIEITGGLDAGEYLTAGHDTATNSIIEFDGDVKFEGEQWARTWFVDTNGDEADTTLGFTFDDAGLTGLLDPAKSYQLLYSDSNLAGSFEILTDSFSIVTGDTRDVVTFGLSSGQLSNGFYTLGIGIGQVPEPTSFVLLSSLLGMMILRRRRR